MKYDIDEIKKRLEMGKDFDPEVVNVLLKELHKTRVLLGKILLELHLHAPDMANTIVKNEFKSWGEVKKLVNE